MDKKLIWGIVIILVVAGAIWLIVSTRETTFAYEYKEDTTVEGGLAVLSGENVLVVDGAVVTVNGDLTVDGAIECRNGPITLIVKGDATINESLTCDRGEDIPDFDSGLGVSLIIEGSLTMGPDAEIETNGHVQIVDSVDGLATTKDELERIYNEIETVPEEGISVGPFVSDDDSEDESAESETSSIDKPRLVTHKIAFSLSALRAHAQVPPPVVIRGKVKINTPPKGVRRIVVRIFAPGTSGIEIRDFELTGPDGRKGTDDTGGNCDAKGGDGENAFRFNAFAPNITVNNFTLNLGSGGDGGDAETPKDCDPGVAEGGKGGKAGNFRMVAGNKFQITGEFNVHPGDGGHGGNATARGKDGGPSEDGGDAKAKGGKGADNKKKLSVTGSVSGTENVQIGDLVAGSGGGATAEPGTGGAGKGCKAKGGKGGDANAEGGDGGDAKLTLGGSAQRMALAKDIGGKGALAEATGARGGDGGDCDPSDAGGDAGDGGDAEAKEGKGGLGSGGRSSDGTVLDETGGDGGDGGDGCPEGKGGSGGSGDPDGKDGVDGANLCQAPPSSQTSIDSPDDEISVPDNGDVEEAEEEEEEVHVPVIQVIQYMDYLIPVDQLTVVLGHEPLCDGDHWHAEGMITNTRGFPMEDPDPDGCGFGKLSDVPAMEIPDPAFQQ